MIAVQSCDFNIQDEYEKLIETANTGAIVTFVGRVRDFDAQQKTFFLQHYPGMTEKVLHKIEQSALQRWDLLQTRIIHRVGQLAIDDQIVYVGVSSRHRRDAFAACEFIIDILKTEAPFWKKEGEKWVEAKHSDQLAADKWLDSESD